MRAVGDPGDGEHAAVEGKLRGDLSSIGTAVGARSMKYAAQRDGRACFIPEERFLFVERRVAYVGGRLFCEFGVESFLDWFGKSVVPLVSLRVRVPEQDAFRAAMAACAAIHK